MANPDLWTPSGAVAKQATATTMPAAIAQALDAQGMNTSTQLGPGRPINPSWGYSTRPRAMDYPAGINTAVGSSRVSWGRTSFAALRGIIDAYDVARMCINHKVDELLSMEPLFVAADGFSGDAEGAIAAARLALEFPDRELPYDAWLSKWLEDVFRYDAGTLYRRRNYEGDIIGLEVVDGTCYSADTEILTGRGWLTFDKVDIATDVFATRNQTTHAFEWQQATYYHEADWSAANGDVYHFTSRTLDLLVTPNHRMLVTSLPRALGGSRHRGKGEAFVRAEDLAGHLSGRSSVPATSEWDAPDLDSFHFPHPGKGYARSVTRMDGDDFAAFMGMWLSEGSLSRNTNFIHVTQSVTSKGYVSFRDLLTRILGREPNYHGAGWKFRSTALSAYLQQFGHAADKFIPAEILGMSRRQLEIFWRFYMLGDGCYSGGREQIVTVSRRMADGLQEVAQKLGGSASVRPRKPMARPVVIDGRTILPENCQQTYAVRLRWTPEQIIGAVEAVPYEGKVYCVSVPNETLYVRRNGQPAWCGNTIEPKVDEYGRRPRPPAFAWEQIIKGLPTTGFTSDDLIPTIRRPQPNSPFGLAPMESILLTANTDLKFQVHFLELFTDGTVPHGIMEMPENQSTPDQVAEFQDFWDAMMMGDQAMLRRIRFVPFGAKLTETRPQSFDTDFSEYLMSRTAAAFGVVPQDLGLVKDVNRASGETQTDIQFRVNTLPWVRFVEGVLTRYLKYDLGLPVQIKLDTGRDVVDRAAEAQAWSLAVNGGAVSVDEWRQEVYGLPTDNENPTPRFVNSPHSGPIPLRSIFDVAGVIDPETGAPDPDVPLDTSEFDGAAGILPTKAPGGVQFKRAPINPDDPLHPELEHPVPGSDLLGVAPATRPTIDNPQEGEQAQQLLAAEDPNALTAREDKVAKDATAGVTSSTGIAGSPLAGTNEDDDEDEIVDLTPSDEVAKAAELASFARFSKARIAKGRWRDFTFTSIDPATALLLNQQARELVDAGKDDGRG